MDRPLIVITWQGVLGDFINEQGVSVKQDHLVTKKDIVPPEKYNFDNPTNLWVRMGTIDGLKYLAKHFQIVIFNRDTDLEDHGKNYSQINEISKYIAHNDIIVDAVYSQQTNINQKDQDNDKKMKNEKGQFKIPLKTKDIWEDYKQIYLDFGLNNDK